MQSGGGAVVGHLDLCANFRELIQCEALGGSRVSGGEHPKFTAPPDKFLKRFEEGLNTGHPDERHDEVDSLSRMNLGLQLMHQPRFAW